MTLKGRIIELPGGTGSGAVNAVLDKEKKLHVFLVVEVEGLPVKLKVPAGQECTLAFDIDATPRAEVKAEASQQ
jgi:hypothetical protein